MKESDRYQKIVEWSDEDQVYIGTCPDLFLGGCHGDDEAKVYKELCEIVDEWIEVYKNDGDPLPEPKPWGEYHGKSVIRVETQRRKTPASYAYPTHESLEMNGVCVVREDPTEYKPGTTPKRKKKKPCTA